MRTVFRRIALGLGLAAFFVGAACAEPPQPMLWKASKGGNTVWLLGSMHILKPDDYPLSADVESAYREADRLVFEVSPEDMNSPATAADSLKHSMFQDGKTLQSVVSPDTWKALAAYCVKNNLPAPRLQMLKPWAVSMMLVVLESGKLGLDANAGLDQHFMKMATTDRKPTQGLESVGFQLSLLDNPSMKMQEDMLRQGLDEMTEFAKDMTQEHDIWRRGDDNAMLAVTKKDFAKYPDLYRQIIVQRNRNWVPQIEKMLAGDKTDTLVIVGALHLLGPDGVVHLLQKDGYDVVRICTGCRNIHGANSEARRH